MMFDSNVESPGIGVDIERIDRFQKPVDEKDERFLNRIFTPAELDYCLAHTSPYAHLAARYAGKEAVVKALNQAHITGVNYSDIEILNDSKGVPVVSIKKEVGRELIIKVSLSHSDDNAIAFAMVLHP
jgi:holo-[acyl-carrier protein] synthase